MVICDSLITPKVTMYTWLRNNQNKDLVSFIHANIIHSVNLHYETKIMLILNIQKHVQHVSVY